MSSKTLITMSRAELTTSSRNNPIGTLIIRIPPIRCRANQRHNGQRGHSCEPYGAGGRPRYLPVLPLGASGFGA